MTLCHRPEKPSVRKTPFLTGRAQQPASPLSPARRRPPPTSHRGRRLPPPPSHQHRHPSRRPRRGWRRQRRRWREGEAGGGGAASQAREHHPLTTSTPSRPAARNSQPVRRRRCRPAAGDGRGPGVWGGSYRHSTPIPAAADRHHQPCLRRPPDRFHRRAADAHRRRSGGGCTCCHRPAAATLCRGAASSAPPPLRRRPAPASLPPPARLPLFARPLPPYVLLPPLPHFFGDERQRQRWRERTGCATRRRRWGGGWRARPAPHGAREGNTGGAVGNGKEGRGDMLYWTAQPPCRVTAPIMSLRCPAGRGGSSPTFYTQSPSRASSSTATREIGRGA